MTARRSSSSEKFSQWSAEDTHLAFLGVFVRGAPEGRSPGTLVGTEQRHVVSDYHRFHHRKLKLAGAQFDFLQTKFSFLKGSAQLLPSVTKESGFPFFVFFLFFSFFFFFLFFTSVALRVKHAAINRQGSLTDYGIDRATRRVNFVSRETQTLTLHTRSGSAASKMSWMIMGPYCLTRSVHYNKASGMFVVIMVN